MKNHTQKTLMIALIGLSLLAGCQEKAQKVETRELITVGDYEKIVGPQWILESMTIDKTPYTLSQKMPTIQFSEDQKVAGLASLNRFSGSFQFTTDRQIAWPKPLMMTRMAGPENLMKQEDAFVKALQKAQHLSLSGNRLYLYTKDHTTELVFYVPVQ